MKTRNDFTSREIDVLNLVFEGMKNKDIALNLNISVHTVKSHLEAIYLKLGVNNRLRAALAAADLGLIKKKEPLI